MKIYLSARYSRYSVMQGCRDVLEALGHKVTSRWIDQHGGQLKTSFSVEQLNKSQWAHHGSSEMQRYAAADLEDVANCDMFIAFLPKWYESVTGLAELPVHEDSDGKGGRHVELGYAMALGKRIVVIGEREHLFHAAKCTERYENWDKLLIQLITELRTQPPLETAASCAPETND